MLLRRILTTTAAAATAAAIVAVAVFLARPINLATLATTIGPVLDTVREPGLVLATAIQQEVVLVLDTIRETGTLLASAIWDGTLVVPIAIEKFGTSLAAAVREPGLILATVETVIILARAIRDGTLVLSIAIQEIGTSLAAVQPIGMATMIGLLASSVNEVFGLLASSVNEILVPLFSSVMKVTSRGFDTVLSAAIRELGPVLDTVRECTMDKFDAVASSVMAKFGSILASAIAVFDLSAVIAVLGTVIPTTMGVLSLVATIRPIGFIMVYTPFFFLILLPSQITAVAIEMLHKYDFVPTKHVILGGLRLIDFLGRRFFNAISFFATAFILVPIKHVVWATKILITSLVRSFFFGVIVVFGRMIGYFLPGHRDRERTATPPSARYVHPRLNRRWVTHVFAESRIRTRLVDCKRFMEELMEELIVDEFGPVFGETLDATRLKSRFSDQHNRLIVFVDGLGRTLTRVYAEPNVLHPNQAREILRHNFAGFTSGFEHRKDMWDRLSSAEKSSTATLLLEHVRNEYEVLSSIHKELLPIRGKEMLGFYRPPDLYGRRDGTTEWILVDSADFSSNDPWNFDDMDYGSRKMGYGNTGQEDHVVHIFDLAENGDRGLLDTFLALVKNENWLCEIKSKYYMVNLMGLLGQKGYFSAETTPLSFDIIQMILWKYRTLCMGKEETIEQTRDIYSSEVYVLDILHEMCRSTVAAQLPA